uniref:Uncharacterized protein n=1 Tax=Anguilla anguilla TaxID=7936 RepID=A0A0E9S3F8_ANGAN
MIACRHRTLLGQIGGPGAGGNKCMHVCVAFSAREAACGEEDRMWYRWEQLKIVLTLLQDQHQTPLICAPTATH